MQLFSIPVMSPPSTVLRKYIHGIDIKVPVLGKKMTPFIFFDNAASTPPLKPVLRQMDEFMRWY